MLIERVILAAVAVAFLALGPRSAVAAVVLALAGVAGCDVILGASVGRVIEVIAPLVAFLTAAITLARLVERSGLAQRAAGALAATARGRTPVLYALVRLLCVAVTAAGSLTARPC